MGEREPEAGTRQAREREFHDRLYAEGGRERLGPLYSVVDRSKKMYQERVEGLARDADLLEIGCGRGGYAFDVAPRAKHVTGIDISPIADHQAQAEAAELGVEGRTTFETMDAEALRFPDSSFDVVFGSGVLHHLNLNKVLPELARVIRPHGVGVFHEPLGHNPVINWFRNRTPELRSPDEHPLVRQDLDSVEAYFSTVKTEFFHLLEMAAVPVRRYPRAFRSATALLGRLDKSSFNRVPSLKYQAWFVILQFEDPIAT